MFVICELTFIMIAYSKFSGITLVNFFNMERFSNSELADIHFIYGYCNGNARAAVREYQRRFPGRRLPHRMVFSRVHRNLVENGSFRRSQGQGRHMGNYDFEGALNRIEENPQIALRPLANIINIPKSFVSI